jgi:hypothetical protein
MQGWGNLMRGKVTIGFPVKRYPYSMEYIRQLCIVVRRVMLSEVK